MLSSELDGVKVVTAVVLEFFRLGGFDSLIFQACNSEHPRCIQCECKFPTP